VSARRARVWLALVVAVGCWHGVATAVEERPARHVFPGACPSECCVYGRWTVQTDAVLRDRPDARAPVVGRARAGTTVEAITGEVQATAVRFVVRHPHGRYRPGDTVWVYAYVGEGTFMVWRDGALQEEDLGFSPYGGSAGARCEKGAQCWGTLEKRLRATWWVRVRTGDGGEGWSDQPDRFGRKDACGGGFVSGD
jgi:hypothetical protein